MPRQFEQEVLLLLRSLPLTDVLDRLGEQLGFFWRRDADFQPKKDRRTQRFYVSLAGMSWELVVTGPKWFDIRAKKGGGGGIDLVMHLAGVDFGAAVELLVGTGVENQRLLLPTLRCKTGGTR